MALLQAENLCVDYPISKGIFKKSTEYKKAVNQVSFQLEEGEVLSIIGESGSGKTTIGNAILGLYPPTSGSLTYRSDDITEHWFKGDIQAVFQNPYSSLNPRANVLSIVSEPVKTLNQSLTKDELLEKVEETLLTVGIDPGTMYRYPHEFSGGQRQRISIARAIISGPKLLILDEPVSSLDVSIRAQILNLLSGLKRDKGLSYIYISHDLATVRFLSQSVVIIYEGRVMEKGDAESVFNHPANPYTRLLFKSAKDIIVDETASEKKERSEGCPFYARCPLSDKVCRESFPAEKTAGDKHYVYCHYA